MSYFQKNLKNQSSLSVDNISTTTINNFQYVNYSNVLAYDISNNLTISGSLFVKKNLTVNGTLRYNGVSLIPTWSNPDGNGKISYSGGFVGVNEASPAYPLDVFGIINADTDVYAGQRIGIGTKTPAQPLHIQGTQPNILMSESTSSTDNKHWLYGPSANNLFGALLNDAYNSTTIWLQVQRSGMNITNVCFNSTLVGVNTYTPNNTLDVNGSIGAKDYFYLNNTAKNNKNTISFNNGTNLYKVQQVDSSSNNFLTVGRNANTDLNILGSNGYVGVGTTTPAYNLDIRGVINSTVGLRTSYTTLPSYTANQVGYTYQSTLNSLTLTGSIWNSIRTISNVSAGVYIVEASISWIQTNNVFYTAIIVNDATPTQIINRQFQYFGTGTNLTGNFYSVMNGTILSIPSSNCSVILSCYQNGATVSALTSYLTITKIA